MDTNTANIMGMEVLSGPYTGRILKERMDGNGYVEGYILMSLSEIISCDFEQFLDLCAIRLVDNECLMDINYWAAGVVNPGSSDAGIIIKVRGDASEIVPDDDDDEKDGPDGGSDNG